ncbi:sensor histidine kinase [Couchioplanes caeruleus]|uniref:sensor histidine kinase n=1 Tax=Couchioplanes caeruleus TaxID=56438 RepID=UPI0020BF96BD|nr:sensor histidine kinase [Couchioplanes caeruleus]UQU67104.1 sensor histidine kinase [Couchioplanes caeruleus]
MLVDRNVLRRVSRGWRTRLDQRLRLLPYVALATSTLLVVLGRDEPDLIRQPLPASFAAAVVTAAWLLWFTTLHPQWETRRRTMAVYFVGFLALTATLVWTNPLYGFFAWTGYLNVLYLHGRWRLAGAASVGVWTAVSQVGGFTAFTDRDQWATLAVFIAINITIGTAMTYLSIVTNEHHTRRAEVVAQLEEANDKLAAALAENAGLHAQLLVQAREAGVLDERQRLAGEIHDVLAQGLTGIVTQLEAADQAEQRPVDRRRHLDTAKQLARDSLAEARRSVQALRPRPLDAATLPDALAEVVDGWSARHGVTARIITTGTAHPLLPEIEATLLRTAQEALANVARHAEAGRVALTLSYMEDLVTLDVRDDGAGFDPQAPREEAYEGGYGLRAMRERVQRIAGTLEIESEPGAGTAISACVPAIHLGAAA